MAIFKPDAKLSILILVQFGIMYLPILNGGKGMKKVIVSFFAGVLVAVGTSAAYADVASMIGKRVDGQFPLKIGGELSEVPAITIEGVSYIPLRAAGELFGAKVAWMDGEITMDKLPDENVPSAEEMAERARIEQEELNRQTQTENERILAKANYESKLFELNSRIESTGNRIESTKIRIAGVKEELEYHQKMMALEPGIASVDKPYIPYKETEQYQKDLEKLEDLRSQLTKLESELTELEKQKAELEQQKAELEEQQK